MKISIVTPSYNQAQFIERTLRSVASQTTANCEIEHVIFDGGSTDGTVEILQYFEPKIRWVSKKDNGQADAVNQGILATDGQIIGWLNSDDIYYPGAFDLVLKFFNAHPEIDVVYGMADHIDQNDQVFEAYPTETWDFERLKEYCFICQPALFFRRHVVEQHGLLDARLNYCMDYEYWLRLGMRGVRFAYLKEKLAGSRLYKENKTLGSRLKVHKEINDMLKQLFGIVPDRWLFNYAHAVVDGKAGIRRKSRLAKAYILLKTIGASWRWNRRIPRYIRVSLYGLLLGR